MTRQSNRCNEVTRPQRRISLISNMIALVILLGPLTIGLMYGIIHELIRPY